MCVDFEDVINACFVCFWTFQEGVRVRRRRGVTGYVLQVLAVSRIFFKVNERLTMSERPRRYREFVIVCLPKRKGDSDLDEVRLILILILILRVLRGVAREAKI